MVLLAKSVSLRGRSIEDKGNEWDTPAQQIDRVQNCRSVSGMEDIK